MKQKYYTAGQLIKMGILEDDIKYRFYRGNWKKFGITLREKLIVEKVVDQEAFEKYFKKLINKKNR